MANRKVINGVTEQCPHVTTPPSPLKIAPPAPPSPEPLAELPSKRLPASKVTIPPRLHRPPPSSYVPVTLKRKKKEEQRDVERYVPVIQRHQLPLTRALHVAPTREGLATQNYYYFIFLRVAGYHHHRSRILENVHRESSLRYWW